MARLEAFLLTHILLPLENMMMIRRATIKDLLELTYNYFELFSRNGARVCPQPDSNKASDALTCGLIVIGLRELGLWPQKSFDTIDLSIRDLASKLKSLVILTYPPNNYANHYHCGLAGLYEGITATLDFIPDPVLDCRRWHMRLGVSPSTRGPKVWVETWRLFRLREIMKVWVMIVISDNRSILPFSLHRYERIHIYGS